MKKLTTIFLLIAASILAFGQPIPIAQQGRTAAFHNDSIAYPSTHAAPALTQLFIPPYPSIDTSAHPFIAPGQVFKTVITNNSSHSVQLYPYLNRSGMEQIAWGDSFLLAYLNSQIVGMTDTDAIRLKLVQIVGTKIEKTDLFNHEQIIYNDFSDSDLYSKQNSLMGSLCGAYQKQCGNYVSSSISMLIKTGYFNYSNIRFVQLINHITCEFSYKNGWAFFDPDPQEPFFMIRDFNNTNEFASAMDIYHNPSLVSDSQKYYFVNDNNDSINLANPALTSFVYQQRFDSVPSTFYVPFNNSPLSITGDITLPAHASMVTIYKMPYVLDSVSYSEIMALYMNGSYDSLFSSLARTINISYDSAESLLINGGISLYYSTKTWQPDYTNITPTIKIVIPPTNDTIKINNAGNNNINFDGYIIGSTENIYLPNCTFLKGVSPILWGKNNSPNVTDRAVNYLSGGGIILPDTIGDTISVSFNPMILNFQKGFSFGCMAGDSILAQVFINDSLAAANSTYTELLQSISQKNLPAILLPPNTGDDSLTRMTQNHHKDSAEFILETPVSTVSIFPNPVSTELHVITDISSHLSIMLFDIIGNIVKKSYIYNSSQEINISDVNNGEYIVVIADDKNTLYYMDKITIIH